MEAIKTVDLTKYYGKVRGITNLNLSVREGDFFGFIGPNGAGKSTTIRTLLGLIRPTSGEAYIFGKNVTVKPELIRREVGYLPSEAAFYSEMRVSEILKLSADLRGKDCGAEAKRLCERLELDTTRKVNELSFGNRKKAAIVCALQSEPSLLILDEPTSGLDPLMQREFFEILRERNKNGATVFLSSHVLSEVQHNCARAAIVREGTVIACDSVDSLARANAKRVTLSGTAELSGLEGVRDIQKTDGGASFLFSGETEELLKRLSEGKILDLTISEPDLEEIFIHYYRKEDEK